MKASQSAVPSNKRWRVVCSQTFLKSSGGYLRAAIIEEPIRQRFELPAFSTLNRKAQKVRNQVNDRYFCSLSDRLPVEVIDRLGMSLRFSVSAQLRTRERYSGGTSKV